MKNGNRSFQIIRNASYNRGPSKFTFPISNWNRKKKQEKRFNDTPLNSILDGDEFSVMVQKAVDKSLKTITPQTVEPVKSRLEDTIKSLTIYRGSWYENRAEKRNEGEPGTQTTLKTLSEKCLSHITEEKTSELLGCKNQQITRKTIGKCILFWFWLSLLNKSQWRQS